MADRSGIEWTDATWNPVRARRRDGTGRVGWHCEHVSEGCRNCYAEAVNARLGTGAPYKPAHRQDIEVFLDDKTLLAPLRWARPRKIFLGSMTDVFADFVTDQMLDHIFAVMAACPQHTFQLLTKRSARMRAYLRDPTAAPRIYEIVCYLVIDLDLRVVLIAPGIDAKLAPPGPRVMLDVWPIPNVWLGVSAEDQATADARIPDLLATPATVRWVSPEPLLGALDFTRIRCPYRCVPPDYCNACAPDGADPTGTYDALASGDLHWIVTGGESGPGARPRHPDWARSLRDQCAGAGVPFFDKQHGQWVPLAAENEGFWPTEGDGCIRLNPDGTRGPNGWPMQRVGKKAAGRLLDGVLHDAMPEVRP
jgi:protein gp37